MRNNIICLWNITTTPLSYLTTSFNSMWFHTRSRRAGLKDSGERSWLGRACSWKLSTSVGAVAMHVVFLFPLFGFNFGKSSSLCWLAKGLPLKARFLQRSRRKSCGELRCGRGDRESKMLKGSLQRGQDGADQASERCGCAVLPWKTVRPAHQPRRANRNHGAAAGVVPCLYGI